MKKLIPNNQNASEILQKTKVFLLDLDGTVYIDGEQEWTGSLLGCLYDMGEGFNVTMGYSINADGNIVGDFDEVKITRGVLPPSKFMCRYRRPRGTVVTVR